MLRYIALILFIFNLVFLCSSLCANTELWVKEMFRTETNITSLLPEFSDGYGVAFRDLDGDQDHDLLIGKADGRLAFFRNEGNTKVPRFVLQTEDFEAIHEEKDTHQQLMYIQKIVDVGSNAVPELADIDNDGDPDFAVGVKRSRNWLIRNENNGGNWLKIRLISPQGQAGAFGAKVSIYNAASAGTPALTTRESRSNYGYLGQDDPLLHVGLADVTRVNVMVTFLNGSTRILSNVSANQTVTVDGSTGGNASVFVEQHRGRQR